MVMRWVSFLALASLVACDSGSSSPPSSESARPVTVYAAASLREVVTEIAATWTRKTGREHRLQFESTSTLARQINEGAPADVFITAAPEWLDKVKPKEQYDWLSNRLVCVVPKDQADFDLKKIDSLALADEQVPAGKYGRQALAKSGVPIPSRTIYGHNVRDVLSKVSSGGAKAGIVYATDAALDPQVRVAYTFPADTHDRILYSVGLLDEEGRSFFNSLKEPWTVESAKRYGFTDLR